MPPAPLLKAKLPPGSFALENLQPHQESNAQRNETRTTAMGPREKESDSYQTKGKVVTSQVVHTHTHTCTNTYTHKGWLISTEVDNWSGDLTI